ncbi:MAG: HAMP domain-containing histidine kinase [Muribaculum sp.]|nr:HAMP domain-containing histidine kinase [Muribaculum sp.]
MRLRKGMVTIMKNSLSHHIIFRILRSSVILLLGLASAMLIGYLWGHTRIWSGEESDYFFWHWVEQNAFLLGTISFLLGELFILAWQLYRMGNYVREIMTAMGDVQAQDEHWITLSDDLSEISSYMNRIKTGLRESRMQAKEAEQRKNDLVVYLAHDLKTPLTSVLGYLSILEESPDLSPEQQSGFLSIAHRKAERLEELINEFFEITRFNLSNVELEKRQIHFSRLLHQTIFEFRPMLEEKHLTCRLEETEEVVLYCDLDKIQRVVDNLLRNACFYAYEDTEIVLRTMSMSTERICFTCSNRGPTIPEGKLNRIFEQFYRLDNARTSSTGGAGLGLAIARQIVQLHGGSIRAESENELTTFTVELPLR